MKRFLLFLAVLFTALALITCGGLTGLMYLGSKGLLQPQPRATPARPADAPESPTEGVEEGSKPAAVPSVGQANAAQPPTPLIEGFEQWVIDTIKQNPPVRSATIEQVGNRFVLTLIVQPQTPVEEARRLGDGLVRLTKLYVEPGNGPGQLVGTGYYSYVVYVYLGPGWQLFEGRKPAEGDRVRWIINRP